MNCPQRQREVKPSRCLTCEYCGGFNNGGVLCFKANRKLDYNFEQRITSPDFIRRRSS